MNLAGFVAELRRRRAFRVAVAHALAWAFDITPDGVEPTGPATAGPARASTQPTLAPLLLAFLLGAVAACAPSAPRPEAPPPPPEAASAPPPGFALSAPAAPAAPAALSTPAPPAASTPPSAPSARLPIAQPAAPPAAAPVTTVFVVRHAERAPGDDDPHLSAEGAERAQTLAWMLEGAGVTAIYSTPLNRTLETVRPLAERLGLQVRIVEGGAGRDDGTGPWGAFARRIVEEHRGGVVLIAGHSNTVAPIANAFGVGKIPDLTAPEYDHLVAIAVTGVGEGRLLRLRFGRPAP